MVRRSILVLERNEKIRSTLKAIVNKGGLDYHELKNNEHLLQYLGAHQIDAILLNSSQQGAGNRTVCTIIRNDPQFRRFPIIILYGKTGKLSRYDYLNRGADDFVPMPFTPAQLIDTIHARLRPLGDAVIQQSVAIDNAFKSIKSHFVISPLEKKGHLETMPPAAIFARLFAHKESGVLDLIINKETRTLYFKSGDLIFAETMSKKDDIAEFLAKNRAGSGSGKELLSARIQSGGLKGDPIVFSEVLKESKLMEPEDFIWWLRLHQIDMISDLFVKPQGVYQWQSLDIPEYTKKTSLAPFYTPRIVFEGIRRIKKWWAYRDLLPGNSSVPHLSPDFFYKAKDYGLTERETAMMQIVDGKRNLRSIGELCHIVFPQVENFIYTCRQFQMVAFDIEKTQVKEQTFDFHEKIDMPDEVDADQTFHLVESRMIETEQAETGAETYNMNDALVSDGHRAVRVDDKKPGTVVLNSGAETVNLMEGLLDNTDMFSLFRRCVYDGFTGELAVQNGKNRKSVFWKRGMIIAAMSDDEQERLDNFLLRRTLITEGQYNQLAGLPDKTAGSPNELIRLKILPIDRVFVVVREQVEEILMGLLDWKTGTFSFHPDAMPSRDIPPLEIYAQNQIIRSLHESAHSNKWKECLPASDCMYRLKGNMDTIRGITLTGLERRIINSISEPATVQKITRMIDFPEAEIVFGIFTLEMAGVIERSLP